MRIRNKHSLVSKFPKKKEKTNISIEIKRELK